MGMPNLEEEEAIQTREWGSSRLTQSLNGRPSVGRPMQGRENWKGLFSRAVTVGTAAASRCNTMQGRTHAARGRKKVTELVVGKMLQR